MQMQILQKCYQNLIRNVRHCDKLEKFAFFVQTFEEIGKNLAEFCTV